ncbi:MAG: UvrD-helicase domain-containing protein, partial [Bacteroidales bacterium]|nr:UvrD-helicase domain-containing protein [Bacteroidales bacterium]
MLDIYKASAGSGKTYTLTLEYIKLLFHDAKNYRKTLAVTFTNNACGEMKNRILRALYLLSFKDDADYIKELQAEKINGKTLKKEEIQATAKKIYKDILHNYSFFYIETIDAFTQNVIRNFAKDLGLPAKFTLELRQNEILETIVKNLLINSLDNEDLHKILVDFAYEDIENSTTTDIKKEVKNESNKFFKELYQEVMTDNPRSNEEIKENITKLSLFFEKLEQTKKNTKKQAQIVSDEIQKAITNAGLAISDFKVLMRDTLNIDGIFKSGKFDERIYVVSECCKYGKYVDELSEIYDKGVSQKLKKIQELLIEHNTAKKILEHKKGVILSQYIQNELDTYCKEENTFFLAFANKFLKSIINGSDTPFVYEKIGQTIENIMVDEFQDTSKMQWENFKPIVLNLLSSLKKALIIGDVKQSIYRFRNGNWQLLHNLEHDSELLPYINEETIDKLNVNHRSKKNIVQFNN